MSEEEVSTLASSLSGLGHSFFSYGRCAWLEYLLESDDKRSLAYQFILGLPRSNTVLPVILPTLYLWIVDTLALRRGTWVIEVGTKLSWQIWDGLEIEYETYLIPGIEHKLTSFEEKRCFSS